MEAGMTEWRFFFYAAMTGLAVAFVGSRSAAWIRASMSEDKVEPAAKSANEVYLPARPEDEVDLSVSPSPDTGSLGNLVRQCAATVAPNTMLAIMHTESGLNPLAMHVNGDLLLQRAPQTSAQAIGWSEWLIRRGYSVDMGLMQINSRNLARLNMSVADAFVPCRNIHAAAIILTEQYNLAAQVHENTVDALLAAVSAYNTGNFHAGFRNGYVAKVLTNSKPH
jgi:type IV secretion system protein VirB1